MKKYAAIDIGSNAVRLMIANVYQKNNTTVVKRISLIRVPIRLGEDVFTNDYISDKNYQRMIDVMIAYKHLLKVHEVNDYRAMATSAMRNAKNANILVDEIREKAEIDIEIIDGRKEAEIIFSTKLSNLIKNDKSYIYIDVGGGSTEITIFSKGEIIGTKSFTIGTVRIINNKVDPKVWNDIEVWIKEKTKDISKIEAIGSGGNINKTFKMSGKSEDKTLSISYLLDNLIYLKSFTNKERIEELGLNPDRADVIIPANEIYISAMKWAGARKIHVPKIGLVDGIIRSLYKGII